jgi:hypothetical protein
MTDIGDLISQVAEQAVEPLPAEAYVAVLQTDRHVKFLGTFTEEGLAKTRCQVWMSKEHQDPLLWQTVPKSENIHYADIEHLKRVMVIRQRVQHTLPKEET